MRLIFLDIKIHKRKRLIPNASDYDKEIEVFLLL